MFSLSGRIQKVLARRFSRKQLRLPPHAIVSFTFDDFPRSALLTAGEMLRAHGLHGTYYTALGLMEATTSVGPLFTARDLEKLVHDDHELACHSYQHLSCRTATTSRFQADCTRNRNCAAGLFSGLRMRNFSYPYGDVSLQTKSALANEYDSCRSIELGVNSGDIDLAFLRSTPIYSSMPSSTIRRLIRRNKERGGWLIFYTHDVVPAPSPFGCTVQEFEDVLSLAIHSQAEILTIAHALQRISVLNPHDVAR